ncbi:hypothetical protein XGA_0260 [Xanthomonas hortorum ATCC 19865]|nr:hypothetical protein XGA_0260 [Xanthomonas hortorum ATCC 19865]
MQQVRPPVLLEYDEDTNLKTVYLENTSRQFDRTHTEGTLAYVDRCTAFEDGSADGDWCALVVDRQQSMKLRDQDLTRGIAVDAPLDASQHTRASADHAHPDCAQDRGRPLHAGAVR